MSGSGFSFKARVWNLWLRFLDETNITVVSLCTGLLLYTKSIAVAYFIVGATFCSLSVKVIKKCIRQPRPPHIPGLKMKTNYGMPSTHSASISYLATTILLACINLPVHKSLPPWRILPIAVTLPWAMTVMMSRVWLGHHTWPQVFAGASYGVTLAALWFALWRNGLNTVGGEVEEIVTAWLLAAQQ